MPNTRSALRVRSLTDLVELVPSMLGFHPVDSLVVVVLDDGLVALTARADLPEDDPDAVACQLAPVQERYPDATLLAFAYCAEACRAWSALTALADHVPETTPLLLVHVDGERWHQAPDDEGTPYDDTSGLMAVRAAVEGMAVLPDRRDLAAMLRPASPPRQVAAALKRVARRELTGEQLVGEALGLLEAFDAAPRALALDEAVVLTLASHDPGFRRTAAMTTCRGNAAARRDLWLAVVRASSPRASGQALVLLGLAAWVGGDGALMVVCLERLPGLEADPEWVGFLSHVNARVVHPNEWEQIRADLACSELEPRGIS